MAVTATPTVLRASFQVSSTAIQGSLPEEPAGSIVYVYLNERRAGTTFTSSMAGRPWYLPISALSFGGAPQILKPGDRLYVQARAIGKDPSEPTLVYTLDGITQPGAPEARDENDPERTSIHEREPKIGGLIPLLSTFVGIVETQELYTGSPEIGLPEGADVSVYVDDTFLAKVRSDAQGKWELDLLDPTVSESPLLPLRNGQIVTVKASRVRIDPDTGDSILVALPSVESLPGRVFGAFFERRLFDFYPDQWRVDDTTGDLKAYTKILALTLDEVRSYIDRFVDIFDIERCDPKYFGLIAALLGYPLNRLDSVESQRFQVKNAIQFWRRKGTTEVFRILFYLLDYDVELVELWTEDYQTFYPGIMDLSVSPAVEVYPKSLFPMGPPNAAPELVENGGTWFKSPYFGIDVKPLVGFFPTGTYPYRTDTTAIYPDLPNYCPYETTAASFSLTIEDIRYLIERIDLFRPAHTVMDWIRVRFDILECGPIPLDPLMFEKTKFIDEPGWPYCEPDDPIYYRRGRLLGPGVPMTVSWEDTSTGVPVPVTEVLVGPAPGSTRPDQLGTLDLGVTRDTLAPIPLWTPATSYAAWTIVQTIGGPATEYLRVEIAGVSGGVEPVKPGVGNTVVDGTVTWLSLVATSGNASAPTAPHIELYRDPQPGHCDPIEEFEWRPEAPDQEEYWFYPNRSGYGEGFYPDGPVGMVDRTDWPSRNPDSGTAQSTSGTWASATNYLVGESVLPTVDNGFSFRMIVGDTPVAFVGEVIDPGGNDPIAVFTLYGTITPSSVTINYTDAGAVPQTATDDGAGNITGVDITLGTIDYATGDVYLDFTAGAPTSPVTIDYTATVQGTTGVSEPVWPTYKDGTVVDGGVTWRAETRYPTRDGRLRYAERIEVTLS